MKNLVSILTLVVALTFASVATATPSNPNPCGNHGNNCECSLPTGDGGSTPVSVEDTCSARSDAEAEAECQSRATSDAFAAAVCGNLNFNQQQQVCTPFVAANIKSICTPEVTANAKAYCGTYVENEVENTLSQRIGDIRNICGGNDIFTKLVTYCGNSAARCKLSQEQAQSATASCDDSSVNSFNATQACTVAQSNVNNCPSPTAICVKWSTKATRYRVGKKIVKNTVRKCVKYAKPAISFTNAE